MGRVVVAGRAGGTEVCSHDAKKKQRKEGFAYGMRVTDRVFIESEKLGTGI